MKRIVFHRRKPRPRLVIGDTPLKLPPAQRAPSRLGSRHWLTHLRIVFLRAPHRYRHKRGPLYQRLRYRRYQWTLGVYQRARTLTRSLPPYEWLTRFYGQRTALWHHEHRHLFTPVRYGFHPDVERRIRAHLLGHALNTHDPRIRRARINHYLHSIGWSMRTVGYWLETDAQQQCRANRRNELFLYRHYEALMNLPVLASVAYYGDPRVQGLFFPFRQNAAYRRYEYVLLYYFHPHTTRGVMRPGTKLQPWLKRLQELTQGNSRAPRSSPSGTETASQSVDRSCSS